MIEEAKISGYQLGMLIVGFVFGSSVILNPAAVAYQDAWFAQLLAWLGGFVLLGLYVAIYLLSPEQNLIETLREGFGKYLGSLIGLFYIWYFIHLASLVFRDLGEYMMTVTYTETPLVFLIISFSLPIAYLVKSGIEAIGRTAEITIFVIPISVLITVVLLIPNYDFNSLQPFLEEGLTPVLEGAFNNLSFPFGETVIFLMLFPALNEKDKLIKASSLGLFVAGVLLITITLRDIMVLGSNIFRRAIFPAHLSTTLLPAEIDQLIAINWLLGSGAKITVCIYATVKGLAELFKLNSYKLLALPTVVLAVGLSLWSFDDLIGLLRWSSEIYPYYALPFQIVIPVLLLIILLFKRYLR
ncbi:GerAB/ArcD/ProY family transporter [Fuchsiella alkaliacetigena]|uniref:GerAB/ArcD/ProY family transporter n=1 Tax=Fuchsiella alkaliacetigena TaxID=957042 RepID=UPI00200A1C20|nr:endospore germination permease [Fuchsiella alkaliacetigena]MCK8824224.1 endospore germination permease [Fuchsiella alkaliacetigena]